MVGSTLHIKTVCCSAFRCGYNFNCHFVKLSSGNENRVPFNVNGGVQAKQKDMTTAPASTVVWVAG